MYSGQHTSTFARCKSAALRAALVPVHEQVRHGPAAAAGFLFKKGGAKGGRRTWKKVCGCGFSCAAVHCRPPPHVCHTPAPILAQPRAHADLLSCGGCRCLQRWCMLSGTQLAYFVDAGQVQAKGNIDVSGCSVEKTESAKYEHQFTVRAAWQ